MNDLMELISDQLDADPAVSDDARRLVLAALTGDAALADPASFTRDGSTPSTSQQRDPAGAYISQISVRGFRGIGPQATLNLKPSPGLTIIAGRNGSGKSSFAEALEVALTSTTYRWTNKGSKQWQEAWRNLHVPDPAGIKITFAEEAVGSTSITTDWAADAGLDDMTTAVQRQDQPKQEGLAILGWSEALETYRPILTYEELGALLAAEPSKLYDALATVLGLEQLSDAIQRLDQRQKAQLAPRKLVDSTKRDLIADLSELEDERAAAATQSLKARQLDAAALRRLAAGTDPELARTTDRLHAVLHLALPDDTAVQDAARRLVTATQQLADAGSATTDALERRASLLTAACVLHAHEGDLECPVCGQGRLDAGRAADLSRELAETESALGALRAARAGWQQAESAVRTLITSAPTVLSESLPEPLEHLRATAQTAWERWALVPAESLALAEHVRQHRDHAAVSLTELQVATQTELTDRDEAWGRVASRLATYADQAEDWERDKPAAETTKAALGWLKTHDQQVKNERLRPVAEQAIGIWKSLRQESNVEIAGISLEGANTRRRVQISSSVDGENAAGITVLSQGELHALALAPFLPRASMADSPFRFVILDDPVQAMDPAKVDGLLDVMAQIAEKRQVVVFSHDDRLASAARRGAVDATILEVSRDQGSVVRVRESSDPAKRYLGDAFSLIRDERLPVETKARVLPGLLRMAVEVCARDRYFADALGSGAKLTDVEEAWSRASTTRNRVALAVFEDPDTDLRDWQARATHRLVALRICAQGFHQGIHGSAEEACRAVGKLLWDVRAKRRD